jgi:hypothetical protein
LKSTFWSSLLLVFQLQSLFFLFQISIPDPFIEILFFFQFRLSIPSHILFFSKLVFILLIF